MDYGKICFVIMPFDVKDVATPAGGTRRVDFNAIYDHIFIPAISRTPLPEGGMLEPRRTDRDFFTGDIGQEMFEYLEYSRIALTDITGLNANVFYELGVRHRARQAGTAIFRQTDARIPFDINQIKAFPYEYEPADQAEASRGLITRVLTESLLQNRLDSPVQRALLVQRTTHVEIEPNLHAAENALRVGDRPRAIAEYRAAVSSDPGNNLLHVRLGLLLKDAGEWRQALAHFDRAIAAAPTYAEAYREKGIAENKLYHGRDRAEGAPDGVAALQRAVELNPDDYDAHASLGGALKRAGRLDEALEHYRRATEVSHGHSYPLLNALKLEATLAGKLELDGKRKFQLQRAERSLRAQVATDPPYDPPWSLFDLAEIRLYSGDAAEFLAFAERGAEFASAAWQVKTFRNSLQLVLDAGVDLPGLREGVAMLEERESYFEP